MDPASVALPRNLRRIFVATLRHNQILPNQIKSCGLRNLLHFGHQSLQADEWVVSLNRLNGAMPGLKLFNLQQNLVEATFNASHGK